MKCVTFFWSLPQSVSHHQQQQTVVEEEAGPGDGWWSNHWVPDKSVLEMTVARHISRHQSLVEHWSWDLGQTVSDMSSGDHVEHVHRSQHCWVLVIDETECRMLLLLLRQLTILTGYALVTLQTPALHLALLLLLLIGRVVRRWWGGCSAGLMQVGEDGSKVRPGLLLLQNQPQSSVMCK